MSNQIRINTDFNLQNLSRKSQKSGLLSINVLNQFKSWLASYLPQLKNKVFQLPRTKVTTVVYSYYNLVVLSSENVKVKLKVRKDETLLSFMSTRFFIIFEAKKLFNEGQNF